MRILKEILKWELGGRFGLTDVMPKWKFDRINNHKKYFSTGNYKEQEQLMFNKYYSYSLLDKLITESRELFYSNCYDDIKIFRNIKVFE